MYWQHQRVQLVEQLNRPGMSGLFGADIDLSADMVAPW